MKRPHIICHMVSSIDGKVTGEFLFRKECERATEVYYEINRQMKCNGFICGRVTMEGSFTGGWYPDLSEYLPCEDLCDFVSGDASGFYAVCFDPHGKLGWKSGYIVDDDPGYDGAQIIEVLTKQADRRYLGYLREMGIPYLFAGDDQIDVNIALCKLREFFGIEKLLLEGGSIINGYFLRADAVDELSIVIAPVTADASDKPIFMDGLVSDFEFKEIKPYPENVLWLWYKKAEE